MNEDSEVKAPVTRLRRRISVEQSEDGKSPALSTPTKKRGGRKVAKPELDLIDENVAESNLKKTTKKNIPKDIAETVEDKPITPSRRSARIKSNTSIVSDTVQNVDSPRAKRAARRTSQVGSDSEMSLTPARQTRRTRKDSTSSIEKHVDSAVNRTQIPEVIKEEAENAAKSISNESKTLDNESTTPTSLRQSPRLLNKKSRLSNSSALDENKNSSFEKSDSDSEQELETNKNFSLLDNEAEEVSDKYESGDSQDEEERQYEKDNEIVEKGETLTTEDELSNDSDYEKDSFLVTSDDEDNELLSDSINSSDLNKENTKNSIKKEKENFIPLKKSEAKTDIRAKKDLIKTKNADAPFFVDTIGNHSESSLYEEKVYEKITNNASQRSDDTSESNEPLEISYRKENSNERIKKNNKTIDADEIDIATESLTAKSLLRTPQSEKNVSHIESFSDTSLHKKTKCDVKRKDTSDSFNVSNLDVFFSTENIVQSNNSKLVSKTPDSEKKKMKRLSKSNISEIEHPKLEINTSITKTPNSEKKKRKKLSESFTISEVENAETINLIDKMSFECMDKEKSEKKKKSQAKNFETEAEINNIKTIEAADEITTNQDDTSGTITTNDSMINKKKKLKLTQKSEENYTTDVLIVNEDIENEAAQDIVFDMSAKKLIASQMSDSKKKVTQRISADLKIDNKCNVSNAKDLQHDVKKYEDDTDSVKTKSNTDKYKKRKNREDDIDANKALKVRKENSFDHIHISRLPPSILTQLDDKPNKNKNNNTKHKHKDIYVNKYSACLDMDLYITDSLQDMLDMDIKNEIATDLSSITDFPDSLGLNFSELPPLLDIDTDNSVTWLNNSSSFVHNLDLYGSEANAVMVNPNSVMPSTFADTPVKNIVKEEASNLLLTSAVGDDTNNTISLASPKEEKSHLTFSPNAIKVAKVQEPDEPKNKKTTEDSTQMLIYVRKQDKNVVKDLLKDLDVDSNKTRSTQSGTHQTVRIKTSQPEVIKLNNKNCSILNTSQKMAQQIGTKTIISGNIHILDAQQSRTILANGNKNQATILIDNSSLGGNRQIIKTAVNGSFKVDTSQGKFVNTSSKAIVGEFPKPAYSYSCLIAMALKNSRTGSLPVSEIYNFMCQHFPYFKTAPSGWKNSVRHNLSLNKCFEKIEKPSTNGSQRKGCLWAMNPSKVGKMDEEVLKWSRKDPQAIKNAMVYPDSLEALERGEMKYSGFASDTEAEDDADPDADVELDADLEIDPEVKEEVEEEETIIEQEASDQELEVEEVVEGTGMVGGTYRLLATGPSSLTSYITDIESSEEVSDIEVLDHSYEDIDIDVTKPVKLNLSMTENYTIHSAKRAKTSYIFQPVSTPTHTSRRKTPLVNRVALI
ncbi:unnamed protein product, partial [Iphiclides podalirius]